MSFDTQKFYLGPLRKRGHDYEGIGKTGTSREASVWLRQEAFKRDDWACQKCGAGVEATLHVHHIKPCAEFPSEALDLSNLITLCKNCHNKIHHLPGCGYAEIRRCG